MALFSVGNEFKDRYRNYSSESLIKIVTTEKNNHSSGTIAAAQAILKERGVNPNQVNQRQTQSVAERPSRVAAASVPKKKDYKVVWFIVVMLIIRMIMALLKHV